MKNSTIRILLANNHEIFRSGTKKALSSYSSQIQIVGEAASFEEILSKLPELQIDILLTDDIMSGGDILTFLPLVKQQNPELKIIINPFITEGNQPLEQAIEWADGLLGISSSEQEYVRALEIVYSGDYYQFNGS